MAITLVKRYLPNWIKTPLRHWSDRLSREGDFFESQGRRDVIHKAIITLDFNAIPGCYAEFGCCGANTFGYAAEAIRRYPRTKRPQVAFDSFAGLPPPELAGDEHPRWIAATMSMGLDEFKAPCRRKRVGEYQVVSGFYKDTLRDKSLDFFPPGSIAFAYIDCDVYSSSLDVCRFLLPRLQHGMILAFDDYWCYSQKEISGERRAFIEVMQPAMNWNFEPYQPFGWGGMSFVVEAVAGHGPQL